MVNHHILKRRHKRSYRIKGQALSWLRDYLTERSQSVSSEGLMSASHPLCRGAPQGSALGPPFILYVADMGRIADSFGLALHAYADDGQVYSSCPPLEMEHLRTHLQECILEIM